MTASRLLVLAGAPGIDPPAVWRVLRAAERTAGGDLPDVAVYALTASYGLTPASALTALDDPGVMDRARAREVAGETLYRLRTVAGAVGGEAGPDLVDEVLAVVDVESLPAIADALAHLGELGVDVTVAAGAGALIVLRVWLERHAPAPALLEQLGPFGRPPLDALDDEQRGRLIELARDIAASPIGRASAAYAGTAAGRLARLARDAEQRRAELAAAERAGAEIGFCCNHKCRRFEYRVAVAGDVELATCDDCSQRLVHESGLTWADAAAAGYRRTTERGTVPIPSHLTERELERIAAGEPMRDVAPHELELGDPGSIDRGAVELELETPTAEQRRAVSDASHLTLETDGTLQAMVDAEVGAVSETTRELARLELETRRLTEGRSS